MHLPGFLIIGAAKSGTTTLPMRPETCPMLLARFREPNRRLAEFLECNLSHWNK